MEILSITPITHATWYGELIFIVMVLATLLTLLAAHDHETGIAISSCIVAIILFVIFISCPMEQEDRETAIYTVEITDSEQYQKLIEDGYTFKRVYDNREIYKIQGPIIDK